MNLFINSPAYYSKEHGIIDDIYKVCSKISKNIDITLYTKELDTVGITPMIAPKDVLLKMKWKDIKHISLNYRMADISIASDYDLFFKGDMDVKKELIIENILLSLKIIDNKLKNKFDYESIEHDIKELVNINTMGRLA